MTGRTIFEGGLEILAVKLIERYPISYLSKIKIVRPHAIAIRVPDGSRPNTSRGIIRGLDQEVRAFEITYRRAEGTRIPFSSFMSTPIKSREVI